MSDSVRGRFYWYELLTTDVEAAKRFYAGVVGWGIERMPIGEHYVYDMWANREGALGGVAALEGSPGVKGAPPHWLAYAGTPDIEATVARAVELGATVHVPPMDIPGTGRLAVLTDPQGAAFAVYTPLGAIPESDPHAPGAFSWHELYTTDPEAAWAFYTDLFGWAKTGAMDLGPAGEYRMFGRPGGASIGGLMRRAPEMPSPSHWLYYVTVPDLDAALDRVRALGGQVVWGPHPVPGDDTIATCLDPQGAVFALYQRGGARA